MSEPTPIWVLRENVNDDSVCINRWLVAERSRVEKGQPIVEVETSKVNMEISAPASGFLRHVYKEGEDVQVGKVLGYICDKAEAHLPEVFLFNGIQGDQPDHQEPEIAVSHHGQRPTTAKERTTRFSQQALQLIKEWGLDAREFNNIGLVRSQDVLKRIGEDVARQKELASPKIPDSHHRWEAPVPAVGVTFRTEKLPRSKRLEAKYLWSAYKNTLPSAVTVPCSADGLHTAAERKYPVFNAYYADGCVNYYEEINIGFAIDAGRGLIVPVIRDADKKSVAEIAGNMRELLVEYLSDEISVKSLMGGTFTLTDLSSEGVHSFQPMINRGQSAILAVCSQFPPAQNQEGVFNLVLVFDHQLSEGRQAARFLNELRLRLEGYGSAQDKQQSKQSELAPPGAAGKFAPPRTSTEEILAGIWAEVFGHRRVGVHDSFLELGGHSLLAATLLFRVEETFHVKLPLRCLFEAPTVAALAVAIEQSKSGPENHVPPPIIVADPDHQYEPFALTDVQQAYWIGRGNSLELGNVACHIYVEIELAEFDRQRFELVLQRLIERHDMLRAIVLPDGRQQILKHVPRYDFKLLVLRDEETQAADSQVETVRDRMSTQVLDTDRWPLFELRASLLDNQRVLLHISLDLLILDARSIQILVWEFSELYRNLTASLPPLQVSFRDYVQAESALQGSDSYRRSQEYWSRRLPTLPPAPELPLAKNPSSVARPRFVRRSARLEPEIWTRLKKRAARVGLTPPGVLLAAFAEVLSVWSKSPQFTINLTLFNRLPLHPQVNDIVGDFTSLNMLAVDNSGQDSFEVRARRIQAQLWSDLDHRYFTGIRVLRELSRTQKGEQRTTMPVVFTSFLNLDAPGSDSTRAVPLGKVTFGITQTSQIWLDNLVQEQAGALICNWDAVEELFPDALLDDMFNGYQLLLQQLASDDSHWHRGLAENTHRLIPPAQMDLRQKVNDTKAVLSDELLHAPFLAQVEKRPSQIAVSTPTRRLTYEELYRRACRVEERLLNLGVQPNQLVAIVMEKGWEQVVAVLGILFAGGAYLPIDSELPAERQRYLFEHGEVKVVLTQSTVQKYLNVPAGIEVLAVDLLEPAAADPPVPRKRQKTEDLAYVIYTSGSTGLPKGVMIDHRGALNTVLDINRRFDINPADRVLALSRLSFDLSVYDIFGLLAAGGTIVMPRADLALDVTHWGELVASERVTVWNTVPALMQLLFDHDRDGEKLGQSLRLIMMSGDWIPVSLPGQISQILPQAKIVSLGGATEGSIWSILYPIGEIDSTWKSIPYGKPMLNQTFHVMSQAMAPCPVWVPGHLYIGGIGVAKGYWRDKQKTDASFVAEPISGRRLYRTGDLGRYLPDGNIEFLGREDFQVKLQGYRIELGEIEVQLLGHQDVENCVVTIREDNPGEKRLVGYVIAKPGIRPEAADLREHLRQKLPEHMVPSVFVFVDRFSLTGNGKVDRAALPKPALSKTEMGSASAAPLDSLELQLTKLWEKILGVHPVGRKDNFFDLGGYSLAAVRLFSELGKVSGRSLPLSTLFQAPTVEKLAEILRQRGWSPSWSSLVPIQPGGSRPPFFCVHGGGGNVLLRADLDRITPSMVCNAEAWMAARTI